MSISPRILFTSRGAPATFRKIKEVVLAAAATSITFTGLDINTHKSYVLDFIVKNASIYAADIRLFVNNDQIATNYYSQYLYAGGTAVAGARYNSPIIMALSGDQQGFCIVDVFRDVNGYYRTISRFTRGAASAVDFCVFAICKTATVTNITRLDIVSTQANGLAAGTRAILFAVGV